jgi:multidrug efflux pump subunit AcrA (membrane-fusion protein)
MMGYDEEPNELVLRIPQLNKAVANVESAQAQLAKAERDLLRTKVRAPFDGRVRHRSVGLGQSVGSGTDLGTVFSTDYAEVRLPIAARELPFLTLPERDDDPSMSVELRDALMENSDTVWQARIVRTEGALDEGSRELFTIAKIEDPFGRKSGAPPLRIGQPVLAAVRGRILDQVYVIPRTAVRELNRIFLVDKKKLILRRHVIEPVWSDKDYLVIRDPSIDNGSLLATSALSNKPNKSPVEIIPKDGKE